MYSQMFVDVNLIDASCSAAYTFSRVSAAGIVPFGDVQFVSHLPILVLNSALLGVGDNKPRVVHEIII